jgi:hypothetical protein
MPFMVIYRTSEKGSCYEQADAIDEAALFVERLRNSEGIDQIRIYRMEEISFAFRPYYKVELGLPDRQRPVTPPEVASRADSIEVTPALGEHDSTPPAVTMEEDEPAGEPTEARLPDPPSTDEESEPAGANGRRGLFGR